MDGLDGNGLLKAYVFSMEDKMAAGAFGRGIGTMCETAPLSYSNENTKLDLRNDHQYQHPQPPTSFSTRK